MAGLNVSIIRRSEFRRGLAGIRLNRLCLTCQVIQVKVKA